MGVVRGGWGGEEGGGGGRRGEEGGGILYMSYAKCYREGIRINTTFLQNSI